MLTNFLATDELFFAALLRSSDSWERASAGTSLLVVVALLVDVATGADAAARVAVTFLSGGLS